MPDRLRPLHAPIAGRRLATLQVFGRDPGCRETRNCPKPFVASGADCARRQGPRVPPARILLDDFNCQALYGTNAKRITIDGCHVAKDKTLAPCHDAQATVSAVLQRGEPLSGNTD